MNYQEFLQSKIDIAEETGFEVEPEAVNPALKPHQRDAVLWALNHTPPVTAGTSADRFSPDMACTRAQAVTFLWRAFGCPAPKAGASRFADVHAGDYYHDAVLWATEKGITNGTGANTFSPDAPCTRAQIVTFRYRDLNA